MYGNPAAAAPYWRMQHASDCGEMAAADVVGQVTGHEPTEQQITAVAEGIPSGYGPGPMYTPPRGTDQKPAAVASALRHPIESGIVKDPALDSLERGLAQGSKMIVFVNAETIWNQGRNRTNADHFVVVTGIDTKAGVVHLNDSGTPKGRDERVSTATFESAWAAGQHWMLYTR
jgi:hypothetical protein